MIFHAALEYVLELVDGASEWEYIEILFVFDYGVSLINVLYHIPSSLSKCVKFGALRHWTSACAPGRLF